MFKNPIQICWEITYRCNFNCIYCLNNSGSNTANPELEGGDVLNIAEKIAACKPLDVIISGGEPLLKPEIYEALKILKNNNTNITLLTNGTLLNQERIAKIQRLVDLVQISLDTLDESLQNKLLNSPNGYKLILEGIKNAQAAKIPIAIGVVATKLNFNHLPALLDFCVKNNIKHMSLAAVMPQGRAKANLKELEITAEDRISLIKAVMPFAEKIKISGHEPALAFLIGKKEQYLCDGGKSSCAITADGYVMPCAYIREKIASLKDRELYDIWKQDMPAIKEKLSCIPKTGVCSSCEKLDKCAGGCKGTTYSYFGRVDVSNPICVYNKISPLLNEAKKEK